MVIKHIPTPLQQRRLARNRHIVQRRREGIVVAELARRFRLSEGDIQQILQTHQSATGECLARAPRTSKQSTGAAVLSPVEMRRLARNQEIIRLRREGQTTTELAHRFGLSRAWIYRILRAHQRATGEDLRVAPRQRRLARNQDIIRLRREGHTLPELAHRFGLSVATIGHILKAHRRATGENLGRQPRKPHHECPRCGAPVWNPGSNYCSQQCLAAARWERWAGPATDAIKLRFMGRTWPEIVEALELRTNYIAVWIKRDRAEFDLTEAEWRRIFPGSGNYRRKGRVET